MFSANLSPFSLVTLLDGMSVWTGVEEYIDIKLPFKTFKSKKTKVAFKRE